MSTYSFSAQSAAQIVERDWAKMEIRKYRNKIEKLINQTEFTL